MDGMIVKVSDDRFIIPTLSVQESFRPKKDEYHSVAGEGEVIRVRDRLVPLLRLDQILGLRGNGLLKEASEKPWEKLVVVVESKEERSCLMVDELLGQEEIVIKSLGGWLKNVKGIAGGAILGDGRVGLILDIAGISGLAHGE
jgi:two-component system chemotaxis sensor kinase CheA